VPLEPVTVSARSGARSDRTGPGGATELQFPSSWRGCRLRPGSTVNTVTRRLQPGPCWGSAALLDGDRPSRSPGSGPPRQASHGRHGVRLGEPPPGRRPLDPGHHELLRCGPRSVLGRRFAPTTSAAGNQTFRKARSLRAARTARSSGARVTSSPFGQSGHARQNQLGGGMAGPPLCPTTLFVFVRGHCRAVARPSFLPSLVSADLGNARVARVNPILRRASHLSSATCHPARPGSGDAPRLHLADRPIAGGAPRAHDTGRRADKQARLKVRLGLLTLVLRADRCHNELRGRWSPHQRRDATHYISHCCRSSAGRHVTARRHGGQDTRWLRVWGVGPTDRTAGMPQHTNTGSHRARPTEFLVVTRAPRPHRLKVGRRCDRDTAGGERTGTSSGRSFYPSLAALAADSPAMFTRPSCRRSHPGRRGTALCTRAPTWRVGGSLRLTYGARLRGRPVQRRPAAPIVPSIRLFGVRTDRIPARCTCSPRLGFSWASETDPTGAQTTFLRGGVGDFRSVTPDRAVAAAAPAPRAVERANPAHLRPARPCRRPIGRAVRPRPSTIPTQCTDTATPR